MSRPRDQVAHQAALAWRQRNPNATCGWGGSKSDPAPCLEPPRHGGFCCARHFEAIGGRMAPGSPPRVAPKPAPVTVKWTTPQPRRRPEPPAPKPARPAKLCGADGCELELPTRKHRLCATHAAESKRAASRASQRRLRLLALGPAPTCPWPGCDRALEDRRRSYCAAHAERQAAAA